MPAGAGRTPTHRTPPRPDRIRRITGGFAFVPNELLHQGFFASLSHPERSLYFFLVLAGDRNGVSFYAHVRARSRGVLDQRRDDVTQQRRVEARPHLDLGTGHAHRDHARRLGRAH